ncbi:Polyadenylate-binding protein-interacting protein 10-like [Heracleum sosnowskyi]|uniref:Polyadenylate-binding protein-interacting protein 10-like n=1 Tax=Heracleum sosnowskyi TaxID=360622 RepID=A0AAD8MB86_9APIA|nr:Polyadenylate-binding protein-interacting protein 10-like [Heracleum sosnowskyi]
MAARENAEFNADKTLNQTDSLVQTNTNELKLSGAGNFVPGSSNVSAVAEQKDFLEEQSDGVDHHQQMTSGGDLRIVNQGDDGEGFTQDKTETKSLNKVSTMVDRENDECNDDKSLNQTDTLVQTNMNELKLSGVGNSSPKSSNDSADKSLNQTDSLVETNKNELKLSGAGNSSPRSSNDSADKSLNQTDSLVETNKNELKLSGGGNSSPRSSTDSIVKSLNQTDSLVETNKNELKLSGGGNSSPRSSTDSVVKSLNQTDPLVQTTNELKLGGAGNFTPRSSIDSAVAEQKGVDHHDQINSGGDFRMVNQGDGGEGFKQDMTGLEEMFSKLNPMAPDFYPPSVDSTNRPVLQESAPHFAHDADSNALMPANSLVAAGGNSAKKKHIGSSHGKRKTAKNPTSKTQKKKAIRRTVYVSDIDNQINEEQLAALFTSCGQLVDCRICGDPNSVLRFGFVEFANKEGAKNALSLTGTMLGFHTVKVERSRTAIAPVNKNLLPTSEDERERCTRTVYCTNIDKEVTPEDIKLLFESFCGEVTCLKLLGGHNHSTGSAFVEFAISDSAIAALNCSGVILGELPIRVSPSKTPIKQGVPRSAIQ